MSDDEYKKLLATLLVKIQKYYADKAARNKQHRKKDNGQANNSPTRAAD